MKGVVTGAFHMPPDGTPSRGRAVPSRDPDDPRIVDVPAACFVHQQKLGNLEDPEVYRLDREAIQSREREALEFASLSDDLRRRAVNAARCEAVKEEIDALGDLDRDGLCDVARRHKISGVSSRGNEKTVRARVKRGLEQVLSTLTESPPEESPQE